MSFVAEGQYYQVGALSMSCVSQLNETQTQPKWGGLFPHAESYRTVGLWKAPGSQCQCFLMNIFENVLICMFPQTAIIYKRQEY